MDNFLDNESTEEPEKDSVTGESMAELMDLYEESFKRFAEGEVGLHHTTTRTGT